jgi:hypothetical protein
VSSNPLWRLSRFVLNPFLAPNKDTNRDKCPASCLHIPQAYLLFSTIIYRQQQFASPCWLLWTPVVHFVVCLQALVLEVFFVVQNQKFAQCSFLPFLAAAAAESTLEICVLLVK